MSHETQNETYMFSVFNIFLKCSSSLVSSRVKGVHYLHEKRKTLPSFIYGMPCQQQLALRCSSLCRICWFHHLLSSPHGLVFGRKIKLTINNSRFMTLIFVCRFRDLKKKKHHKTGQWWNIIGKVGAQLSNCSMIQEMIARPSLRT